MSLALARRSSLHAERERLVRASIEQHSKSFSLASRLLPARARLEAQVLYAYCRRADDLVDDAPPGQGAARLSALRRELDAVYAGQALSDPLLSSFQQVAHVRGVPRDYPDELLAGMAMDVTQTHYSTFEQLLLYGYRVAGTVGLMMCHVMGVRQPSALRHAAHLGIAMQLTNIARDVLEDWQRGRLYLPDELLVRHGASGLRDSLGGAFPREAGPCVAAAIEELLARADAYYASGDAGLAHLTPRCAFAVGTARRVYAEIGHVLRRRGCDPLSGRAVVPRAVKLRLAAGCGLRALSSAPAALWRRRVCTPSLQLAPTRELLLLQGS